MATFEVPAALDYRAVAVGSRSQLLIGDRVRVTTPSGGFGTTTHTGTSIATYGYDTNVGSVTSLGPVKLLDRARVNGTLTTGGDVTYGANPSSVAVTGGITKYATVNPLRTYQWKVPFDVSTTTVTITSGTTNLAPGSYGSVTLQSGGLKLRTGTYYIDRMTLEPNTSFTIDSAAGPVFLYVRTALIFRTNISGTAEKLLLGYFGTQLLALERTFSGTVVAPNARVRFAVGNTPHSGSVFAKEAELDPGVNLTFRAFAHWSQIPFALTPRFDCVENRPNGTRVAVFGYSNPGAVTTIPVGSQNQFVPAPQNRLQPTTFLPGGFDGVTSVGFTGTALTWSLAGSDAVVDVNKTCANSLKIAAQIDATVKSSSPKANFGALANLNVAPGEFALVAFDRQAILNLRGAGRLIRSARLELDLVSGSPELEALPLQKPFGETAATWNCSNDQDASSTAERCHVAERWLLPRRTGTYDNPYDSESVSAGSGSGSLVVFDVTDDLGRFLAGDLGGTPVAWILQPKTSAPSLLGARESSKPARLTIETVAFSNTDLAGATPFSVGVDTSLATSQELPAFADGVPRKLAVLQSSDGDRLLYAENELIVMTDSQTEIDAIKARWGATEVAAPAQAIPGIPKGRVLRIDTARADTATLVPNLKRWANRPDGLQKVSSDTGLRLLAAAATEMANGTFVGMNWVAQPGAVTTAGFGTRQFIDGHPSADAQSTESSSNDFEWDHFINHRVPEAWKLLHFAGKLDRVIDAAVIDAGFCTPHQDVSNATQTLCASGCCANPFDCGGEIPCPWHGVHVANAGFGEPNNSRAGAGPGAGVTDLTLYWGFGDMGTLLISIPALVAGGEDIINSSTWIPVPDWLFFTTLPAEAVLRAARKVSGRLIFSISGNANKNVDKKRCYNLLIGEICPWEETTWFPCESDGVHCVGGTNYESKAKAEFSNYGKSVRYYATGSVLTSSDPESLIGANFQIKSGTSLSAPFVAGIAALTWAARTSQGAGDVEACLSAARSGGPDGRFLDAFFATACALNNTSNLAPLVEITDPAGDTKNFGSVAPVNLTAQAADYESSNISSIFWSSDVEGALGSTSPGSSLFYQPSGPGLRTVTATASDPTDSSLRGQDSVVLSFQPAPPNLQILAPEAGTDVFAGLPTELIARVTNLASLPPTQPCGSMTWTGFRENSIVFDSIVGCSAFGTFPTPGNGRLRVSATVDSLFGSVDRTVSIVSDGKVHVTITNPLRGPDLRAHIGSGETLTLSAASTALPAIYVWTIQKISSTGILEVPGMTLTGQNVEYTAPAFDPCGSLLKFTVVATDLLGQTDFATVTAEYGTCTPT